jgi:hypothetical protein
MTEHEFDPGHDPEHEALFARAAAALRAPHPDDAAGMEAVLRRLRATPTRRIPRGGVRLPWWAAVAAAAIAFAVGLGVGRTDNRPKLVEHLAAAESDGTAQPVAFVFVAPVAHNVSLVGDFNGWDAGATPLRRTDGRNTWSVAVRLPPGRHVYAFVVDGVTWVADPQAPLAAEQWFGQRNSVIVVAEDHRS